MIAALIAGRKLKRKVRSIQAGAALGGLVVFVLVASIAGVALSEEEAASVGPAESGAVAAAKAAVEGCPQLRADPGKWRLAVAVAGAESHFNPLSFNPVPPDLSYGFWQINMLGALGPPRRVQYGIAANEELFDPVVNAKAMCIASGGGANWQPWSTYTNYAFQDYLPQAEAAVRAVMNGETEPLVVPPHFDGEPEPSTGQLVDVGPCVRAAGCQLDTSWANNLLGALAACRAQGNDIVIVSANRTYAEQSGLYAAYLNGSGGLAAAPGTSNHEGGRAVDLGHAGGGGLSGPGDAAWDCMNTVGPRFGVYQSPGITDRDSVHFSATGS